MTVRRWIRNREIMGRPMFSVREVREAVSPAKDVAVRTELNRLSRQKIIYPVYKGFYAVMPVQYMTRGVVPPLYYIDQLMAYLQKPYYISMLSAAQLHGAAHQRPQRFSVTTVRPVISTSAAKNNLLLWHFRSEIREELLEQRNSETGIVKFSNPELTALDLVQYGGQIGGLSVAATVLEELAERVDFTRNFPLLCEMASCATMQRLGYILEHVLEETVKADTLYNVMTEARLPLQYRPLSNSKSTDGCPRNIRWKIIVNEQIETDDL